MLFNKNKNYKKSIIRTIHIHSNIHISLKSNPINSNKHLKINNIAFDLINIFLIVGKIYIALVIWQDNRAQKTTFKTKISSNFVRTASQL